MIAQFPQGPLIDPATNQLSLEWFMFFQNVVVPDFSGVIPAINFPALVGDITTPGGSLTTTLKNTGTAGTYTKTTFDAQGRETSGSQASASDLSNGVSGTGLIVLSNNPTIASPVLTTPNIGAATATSLVDPLLDSGSGALVLKGAGTTAQTITGANTVFSGTLTPPIAGYLASDASAGITTTVTTGSLAGKTMTFKDGILTSFV